MASAAVEQTTLTVVMTSGTTVMETNRIVPSIDRPDIGAAHAAMVALGAAFGIGPESPEVGAIIAEALQEFHALPEDDPTRQAGIWMLRMNLSRPMCQRQLDAMERLMEIVKGADFMGALTEFITCREVLGLCPADDETFTSKAKV